MPLRHILGPPTLDPKIRLAVAVFEDGKKPQTRECWCPPEAGQGQKMDSTRKVDTW